jgi:hypothetical protein
VAIANGNAAFLSNTWINTGNLSATRTVNFGDLIAVIVGYDGGGRLGTDSFTLTGMNAAAAGFTRLQSAALENLLTGAYSITASTVPVIVLGFNDGTFGTLAGSFPASAIGSHAFNSGSSPNEYALGIQFPFPCKCSGVFINVQAVAVGADFNVVLYGGATPTTVIQSVPVTSKQIGTTGASRLLYVPFTEAALTLNAKYYLSVQPTTVNSVTIPYYDVSNASHFQACGGGANFSEYTRAGGAWTQVTTRRPVMIAEISSFDDATGGGGATAANPVAGFLA